MGRQAGGGSWFLRWSKIVLHEEARVHCEAGGQEGPVDGTCVVQKKLRLDPLNAGRVLQQLEKLVKKGLGDLKHLRRLIATAKASPTTAF